MWGDSLCLCFAVILEFVRKPEADSLLSGGMEDPPSPLWPQRRAFGLQTCVVLFLSILSYAETEWNLRLEKKGEFGHLCS